MRTPLLIALALCLPSIAGAAADAVLVGQLDPSPMLQYVGVWGWTHPTTHRQYAFVGNNATGMYVIDATDPANPVPVATVTSVPRVDMKTYQHYLYSVDGIANGATGILDIANPASPVAVGSFPGGHNIFIDTKGFMYEELPGLRIYDLKPDPTHPALVYTLNVPEGHDVCVVGDRLYEFRASAGTFIWNVTDRSNPHIIGSITDPNITYHHNGWPTRDAGYLFITDEYSVSPNADITVWDIHNVASPFKVASIADPTSSVHNCYVVGNLLAVAYYTAGFKLFDVSDPVHPVLVDAYDTSSYTGEGNFDGAWACYAYAPGNHVYITDRPNGLFIFELAGPTSVRTQGTPPFSISDAAPNPFSGRTRIAYALARGADVTVAVYDVRGERVKRLQSGWEGSGTRELWWDGSTDDGARAPSGAYYVRVQSAGTMQSRKITLVR
jgi:choice-of-anchor B domain-containing protein